MCTKRPDEAVRSSSDIRRFPCSEKNHCASLAQGVPLAFIQTAGKLKSQP